MTSKDEVKRIWVENRSYCPNNFCDYDGVTEKCKGKRIGNSNGYDLCLSKDCPFVFWYIKFNSKSGE